MSELFEELRAALWTVWHRRWIAIAVAWSVCLLGWLVIAMIPNTYESKARVYVDVEDVLSKQLGIAGDGKEEIMRVRQTLSSAKNLEKVITSTRLGEGITERGALDSMIGELEKKVTVTSEQDNLFEITAAIGRGDLSDADKRDLHQWLSFPTEASAAPIVAALSACGNSCIPPIAIGITTIVTKNKYSENQRRAWRR